MPASTSRRITSAVKPLLPLAAEMRVLGVWGTPRARFANPSQRSSVRVSPTSMVSTPVNDSASIAASSASGVMGMVMVGLRRGGETLEGPPSVQQTGTGTGQATAATTTSGPPDDMPRWTDVAPGPQDVLRRAATRAARSSWRPSPTSWRSRRPRLRSTERWRRTHGHERRSRRSATRRSPTTTRSEAPQECEPAPAGEPEPAAGADPAIPPTHPGGDLPSRPAGGVGEHGRPHQPRSPAASSPGMRSPRPAAAPVRRRTAGWS